MTDDGYTIKEFIGHYMEDIKEQIAEIHTDVKEIKIQTLKTNGRVSKLEFWRSVIVWGFGVLVALSIPIGAFIKLQIRNTVVEVLDEKASLIQYEK